MISKKLGRSLALAAATVSLTLAGTHQALATSGTGHASAAIVSAIVLTENTQLNFGFIVPSAAAGTLLLPPTGAPTPTNVTLLNGAVAGAWTAQGTSGQPLVVQLDASDSLTGPGPAMTVDTFTTDAPATFTSGSVAFHIGATLHVGVTGTQTAGTYTGTYTVQVNY